MKELKINIWPIVVIAIIIAIGGILIWYELFGAAEVAHEWFKICLNYGYVIIPVLLIYNLTKSILWYKPLLQNKFCRKYFGLAPDLRGRWEGVVERIPERIPHKFALEITQTMTCIQIYCYSSRGKSESISHNILVDETHDNYNLCFHWRGTHGKHKNELAERITFLGFSCFSYYENSEGRFLEGDYFTNRAPIQTIGRVKLRFQSLELKKQF